MSDYVIYNNGEAISVTKEEFDAIKAIEAQLENSNG
jgi:hypothetical protein